MINPFPVRLVRAEYAAEVVSPPYDALTPAQRAAHLRANPLSYLQVTRSPADEPGRRPDDLTAASHEALQLLLRRGVFDSPRTGLVIYGMRQGDHHQVGIVFEVDPRGADGGAAGTTIVPHEQTRAERADQMAHHLDIVGAWSSPVAVTYRADPAIDAVVAELGSGRPDVELVDHHGSDHRLWLIDDPTSIGRLQAAFGADRLYVIDGHHRLAAARVSRRRPPLLAAAFPDDQLVVRAFHRLVSSVDVDRFLSGLGPLTPVAPGAEESATSTGVAVVVTAHGAFRFELPPVSAADGSTALDVDRLQSGVLAPGLGITDPRTDPRLDHLPAAAGIDAIRTLIGQDSVGIVLHPMSLDDLLDAADSGVALPPKSTSFEPKTRSGLLVRLLDD